MIQYEPGMTIDSAEQEIIEQAFRFYRNNKIQTCASIGISLRTLDTKLETYERIRNERGLQDTKLEAERANFLERARGTAPSGYANERPRVESTPQFPTEQPVPVPEQKEIQEVLPEHTSKGGRKRTG
jgi:hypothetical protein